MPDHSFVSDNGRLESLSLEITVIGDLLSESVKPDFSKELVVEYQPDDPVYIYFTSGSTGVPKALSGRNSGLTHFVRWETGGFQIDETWRFSQLTTPGFDAFLRETIVPLTSGGTVCIPHNKEILLEGASLFKWLEDSRITLLGCVPGLFRLLADQPLTSDRLPLLRLVLLSGERITAADLTNWFDIYNQRIRIVNLWGTSETTLAKTFHIIFPPDLDRERIPVGTPISGAAVMVLDQNMELLEPLVTGELYIQTPFRSFGYYNDPAANAERFIANPFSDDPSDLLHKTGDIGRMLPGGNRRFTGKKRPAGETQGHSHRIGGD